MAENFDDLLSGVVDTASGAAREPGAAAARKRGHQRRTRRRITASTLSLALLGVVGGVAATALPGQGTNGIQTAHATASISPAPSVPASPSPTPSASASASAPQSTTGTPSTAKTGSSTVTSPPDPRTYVAGAWLSLGQLFYGNEITWKSAGYDGTVLAGNVAYSPADKIYAAGMCLHSELASQVLGEQISLYTPPTYEMPLPGNRAALVSSSDQQTYFYANAGAVDDVWSTLASGFQACAHSETGGTGSQATTGMVRQTVDQTDAECWENLVHTYSTQVMPEIYLTCLAKSGTVIGETTIELKQVNSFSTLDAVPLEQSEAAALEAALQAYGS